MSVSGRAWQATKLEGIHLHVEPFERAEGVDTDYIRWEHPGTWLC